MTTIESAVLTTVKLELRDVLMAVADWQRSASTNRSSKWSQQRAEALLLHVLTNLAPGATAEHVKWILESARVGEV